MPRDLFVYTQREGVIPMDDLLSQMRARGLPVKWQSQLLTEQNRPDDWSRGYLRPEGEGEADAHVTISFEEVYGGLLEETLEGYADVLREQDREALSKARARYRLVPAGADEGEPLLVNLADVLAKAGDGLICDPGEGRFYSVGEYESSHADVLGE